MKIIDVVSGSSYEAKVFLPFYPVLGVFVPFFLVRWRFLSILTHAGAGGGEKGADTEAASFLFSDLSSSSILDCGGDLVGRTRRNRPQRPQLLLVPPPPPPPLSPPSPTSGGTKEGERRLTHRETYVHTPSTDSNRATTASLKGTEG